MDVAACMPLGWKHRSVCAGITAVYAEFAKRLARV